MTGNSGWKFSQGVLERGNNSRNDFRSQVNGAQARRDWRALITGLALTLTVVLAGCAGLVNGTNTTPGQPLLQVTPANVTFGSLAVGKKVSQTISVGNPGNAALSISSASLSTGPFAITGITTPMSLAAGQTNTFEVWFNPTAAGTFNGTLTIQPANGAAAVQVALSAAATAGAQQISLSSNALNLGSVKVGSSTSSPLTISNVGGANLSISLLSVSGSDFGVSGISTPATIAPGGSATVNVTFAPTLAGTESGSLIITSNDPQTPSATVTLTGVGTSTVVAPTITTPPASETVTAGQTATFNVVAGGTAPLSYQWQQNGVNISGATASSYTTAATTTSQSGTTFDVVVSNSAGTVTSSAATLTVNAAATAPTITTQPASLTVTAGQTATFTVVANGSAPLSYQWQQNGANISGATSSSYTTPATTAAQSGTQYDVVVSNSAGSVTSASATLTVSAAAVAPTITTQPASQTVTAGQTATFTVVANGTAPLSYQWQQNGVNISGATSSSYTTPATTTSQSGTTFDVVVSNSAGSVTSAAATLTVNAAVVAPTITTQPANQSVTAGQTATFTVVAGGTGPLSYQWQKSGVNISGATASSYTTPATTTSQSGTTFDVVVTNSAGSVTSATVTLTVTTAAVAPTITTQPVSQTVTAGQTATFAVVANGTAPLSYQWQQNGVNINGATSTSYTTAATTTSQSGTTFDVVVSNSAGSVTSASATLTVNAAAVAPTITTQPVSQTVTAGQTATFTVVANGTAPLSYQWQQNGVNISGATGGSYTTPATTTAQSGTTFDVVVSNSAGSVTSAAATLTVNAAAVAPTITTQPVSQTVTAGQTATFAVVANGTAPLSYQWQKGGVNISGATAASYTTPATTTSQSGTTFDVVVTNSAGTVTSATVTLTVTAAAVAPTIATQPVSQTVTVGQTATFTVVANGTAPLSYQWQQNGVNINGATGISYTTPATTSTSQSGTTFDVVVSNSVGSVTSAAATLTVNAVAPTIATQPASQTVTAGQTATFTVVANGTAPLSYQWQQNGVNISGATSSSYTTAATTTSQSGTTFDVVVSNSAGSVISSSATLTVNAAPAPAIQVNSSVTFTSTVVGTTSSQALVIKNTGTATLTISQVNESGAAFSVPGFTPPLSINAGAQSTINVSFTPSTAGAASGSLSIVSNAPTSPTPVTLSGTGVAATFTLSISPTTVPFNSVTTGTSAPTQTVTITNTGNSNVTISAITLSGAAAGFSMTGGGAPVTLTPTQNVVLTVGFTPAAAGSVSGSITITSNATGSPAMVTLTGTGVAPVAHSVTLSWTASTSTVSGYNIYRGTVNGGPYTKINTSLIPTTLPLQYTDSTVASGTTYYYVATAVDSSGNESADSNQVTAAIP